MLRGRMIRCATISGTDQEKWEQLYGTTAYGNLPQHKKHLHDGHCWAPCPYDTTCTGVRTQNMTGYYLDPYYDPNTNYMTISGTIPFTDAQKVLHEDANRRHYYMKTTSKGSAWGYECTFNNCPYKTQHGKPYFYT